MVRVRYAPSPTGEIHIGNARTALFNYLFARHNKGTFILRLDDTDEKRSTKEAIDSMIRDITWLGLDWDEGYLKGGDFGPYRQKERLDIYNHYIDILLQNGFAYELYYTDEEVDSIREEYEKTLKTFSYRKLKENETEERRKSFKEKGLTPAIVFKVEENKEIVVHDLVRGDVVFNSNEFKDFVIRRSNGLPVYNYATVIDDALMKITHVIRAEEHLSNTPKQILIFEALNFSLPTFAHISLILAPDRTKLSKRHGATSLGQFREMGILPEAMFNFLALLGWSPKDNREFFTKEELIELFDLSNVNKAPAIFDFEKLKWMNHKYLTQTSSERIYDVGTQISLDFSKKPKDWWLSFIDAMKEHFDTIRDVERISLQLFEKYEIRKEIIEKLKEYNAKELLEQFMIRLKTLEPFTIDSVLALIRELGKGLKIKGRNLYFPLRLAITMKEEGMEVHEFIYFIGKDETVRRLESVLEVLNA
ncbi:glutamate--tRNA ligase [Caldisericum exile]|uniref:Glutamate--tRNA ligase n=1 Tax=Caldisericum exile (strain DSM 21853 / NBRC 104410 / AZM16c01) TaxID=511051 RepID=A0A7U6JH22_CALEA|nr:glutamate--tRNA ligase [Caldisericum exile]BAL81232.1 glutamyl-tRNA synthetase [Caldisericum exile AZM16c01]